MLTTSFTVSAKFRQESLNRLNEPKGSGFEMHPTALVARQVPKVNLLLGGVDGGPKIFARPLFMNRPSFVEQLQGALTVYFADDMNAPAGNGQPTFRNEPLQIRFQIKGLEPEAHGLRCFPLQSRWAVLGVIPAGKLGDTRLHMLQTPKQTPAPTPLAPQTVKRLDLIIALGFIFWNKHWLHATEQTQAHDLAYHARVRMPATEGSFIIGLVQKRQTQFGPRVQQMLADRAAGFVQVLRQINRVAVMVKGVHILNFLPAPQMAGDDVRGLNSIDFPSGRPRVVSGALGYTQRMRQAVLGQQPLDGGRAGNFGMLQAFQVGLNGATANQSKLGFGCPPCFAGLADRNNGSFGFGRDVLGRSVRCPRLVAEIGRRVALVLVPPFVEPTG